MPEDASINNGQPWSFERIAALHQRAKDAGAVDKVSTLPDFAKQLNDLSGSDMFNAGLKDSVIKRTSLAVDRGLAATGLPDATGEFFGGIGKLIDPKLEEKGRQMGREFPRGLLDSSAVLGGMALSGTGIGASVGVPLMAVGGASTFAKSYTDSDSPVAGLINTAATFALPKFMSKGAELLAPMGKSLGRTMVDTVVNGTKVSIPASLESGAITERALDLLGMNLGAAANQELAQQATSIAVNKQPVNPFTKEHAFELGVGMLPFLPFQLKDVIKGPGAGEFRSNVELNRAEEAAQILNKASKETSQRAYLYTAEKGKVKPTDEYAGGVMPRYGDLSDKINSFEPQTFDALPQKEVNSYYENVTRIRKNWEASLDKSKTLLGEPLVKPEEPVQTEVPLLPTKETTPAGAVTPELKSAMLPELVDLAQKMVNTPARTIGDVKALSETTNQVLDANGDPLRITDKFIDDNITQHINSGLSIQESVERTNQAIQNRLNRSAAELQQKLTKGQQTSKNAQEALNAMPPEHQELIAGVLAKMSKDSDNVIDTDLSDAWTQAAVKWAGKPEGQKLLSADLTKPEARAEAGNALGKVLGGVKKLKVQERERNVTSGTGGAESIFSEEQGGTLKPGVEKLSSAGQEAFGDTVKAENQTIQANKDKLTQDVTLDEAKKYKPKADQIYTDRLSKVISAFAQGEVDRTFSKGKWKFTYHDIQGLRDAFGKVSDKTIMDFVKDNHGVVGSILQDRLGVKFLSFEDPAQGKRVDVDPKVKSQEGVPGAFPASTRAFFTNHFLNKGRTPAEALRLGEVAARVAAAYKDIHQTRIASIVQNLKPGDMQAGISLTGIGTKNGVIGINELHGFTKGVSSEAFKDFYILHILAHEQFHMMETAYDSNTLSDDKMKAYASAVQTAASLSPSDKYFMVKDLFDLVVPKTELAKKEVQESLEHLRQNAAQDDSEFLATHSALVLLGLANPAEVTGGYKGLRDYIAFGDKHMADFSHQQFLDLLDLTDAVKDAFHLTGDIKQAERLGKLNDAFKTMVTSKKEIDAAVDKLRFFDNMNDGGLESILDKNRLSPIVVSSVRNNVLRGAQDLEPGFDSLGAGFIKMLQGTEKPTSGDLLGQNLNFYERNLVPAAQIAEQYPITRPIINLGFTFQSIKNKFVTLALTPFMTPDKFGKLVFDEAHGGISKVLHNETLKTALSHVTLEQNIESRLLSPDEINTIAQTHGLSAEDTDTLHQVVQNTGKAMATMGQALIKSQQNLIGIMAGRILLSRVEGINAQTAHQLGTALTDGLIASLGQTPEAAAPGIKALADAQKAINNPEAFESAMKAINGILPKLVEFTRKITDTHTTVDGVAVSHYTPEVRLGDYALRWVEDGVKQFVGFKTLAEMESKLALLNKNPNVESDSIKGIHKFDKTNDTYLLSSDMVQKFAGIEQSAFETMKAMFPDDAPALDKLGYVPGEAAFKEVTAQGMGKYTLKRNFVGGREEINMMEGVLDYVTGVSGGLAKAYTRNLATLYLADPTMKSNPKVAALLRDHIASVTSSPKEWTAIKNAVFHFTLGGNLSSILVERLQPLFTLVPHLTQNGSGIAGSYQYIGKAMKTLWQVASKDTTGFDPKLQIPQMLERASKERVIDFGIYEELASQEDLGTMNLRNLATSNPDVNTVGSVLAKPLFWYTRFARNLYTKASAQNSRVAFLSSYLLASEKGLNGKRVTPEEAYQFAYDSVHTTMFGGGRAGRPIGMFSNLGKTYGAVSALYMLQHYTTSSIAMMYRLTMDGLGKTGLAPYQTNLAKKALGQMVLTQTLMAGTLGLPLVGGTLSILEQIFPSLQAKKAIRETLAGLAGDDKAMGELISDSFLHGGLPRALGAGMVDLSGRFGLGNLFAIDPEYGFRPENVLGAAGSVFGNILRGAGNVSQGRTAEGIEQMVPSGWRNLIRMYNDDWNVRDTAGRLIFQPDQTETLLGAVGFRPKKLAQFQEQQLLLRRSDQIASRELQKFHGDLADLMLQGQTFQVRALLLQRHAEDPLYDPRAGLHAVVQSAQDKVVQLDPNRGGRGSLDEREKESQTFGSRVDRPSETDLLLKRKQMERQVGILGAGTLSRHELTISQMADQLLASNPTMGRQMARVLVEKQLAHRPY